MEAHPLAAGAAGAAVAYFLVRLLSCGLWLATGVYQVFHYRETLDRMVAHRIPWPQYMLFLVLILKLAGSLMLLSNQYVWAAALAWSLFLIPATLLFHLPALYDRDGKFVFPEMIQFSKNVSLLGGLVALILLDPDKPAWLVKMLS
jgi:uncharacterized membrane protein YphA (DoxX/SURF4 family)